VVKVVAIIRDGKFKFLLMYYFFPGMCVGFYATYLYKLIGMSISKDKGEEEDDYTKRVSFYSGLVFIALGASQALTGFVMNRVGEKFCKFKLAVIGTLMVEVAGFVSLLCYFLNNYYLCFAVSFLWGSAETFLQTNTGALIGIVFPGKVESYSVFRIIFAIGTVTTIVLNIALKDTPAWIFLTIVMTVQVVTTGLSTQIINLKHSADRKSLIDSEVM
jgi:MFS family permease